ncbi:MAG TPA: HAMP domain-containing sensor histidine kinase [Agriterribacter sp.]|nr:HAMP domain-containing sensor histidine kinase [Agriterribacter sp.]
MPINAYNRFGMRSATLKWMVLTGAVIIGLIIAIQLYWLNHIYQLEQKQFDTNTVKSIRGLFEDMNLSDRPASHLQQLISTRPAPNTFVIRVDNLPNRDTLTFYLTHELMDFDILTECKVALYDKTKHVYIFQQTIPSPDSGPSGKTDTITLYPADYHYILLHFPDRSRYILSQMNLWIISSIVVVLLLLGLAISMFYFYKQKFLVEIQKDFVNNFTHEFKTPLAVMRIASDVLSQPSIAQQPERMEKYTNIISHETEHLQNQVERLLKMAVSDQKDLRVEMETFPVKDLIDQAVSKLQPLMEASGAKVEIKIKDDEISIRADKTHLELAIVNLIENGIKYSLSPVIVIEAGRIATESYIAIKDNGVGIDKKYYKNIFKKFYRVPTGDVHNVKGFGLGLNFVKKIIDAHNGKIVVNSVPGIGTEFKIILPT